MNLNAFLLVDAGNTRVKWASTPIDDYDVPLKVAGEIATTLATAGHFRALAKKYPRHYLVLASVVPRLEPIIRQAFKRRFYLVGANSSDLRLDFDYPNPDEIGIDRLAAAVAVRTEKLYPAIIVACGTATAFTVLDRKGRFCGGAISPGLHAQLSALVGATAQLAMTDLKAPRNVPGKSTAEAIRGGLVFSYLGGVKEILVRLTKALPGRQKPRIILTGGDASLVAKYLDAPFTQRPLLVLEGLRIIAHRVWNPKSE
jgi:type III pantothenate kinase